MHVLIRLNTLFFVHFSQNWHCFFFFISVILFNRICCEKWTPFKSLPERRKSILVSKMFAWYENWIVHKCALNSICSAKINFIGRNFWCFYLLSQFLGPLESMFSFIWGNVVVERAIVLWHARFPWINIFCSFLGTRL